VGQNKANPLAAIVSGALMLEFLGEDEAAATITRAVQDYARTTTNTQASTTEIGDAIAGKV
jgi:3-isopropylmalate dehydrogenase